MDIVRFAAHDSYYIAIKVCTPRKKAHYWQNSIATLKSRSLEEFYKDKQYLAAFHSYVLGKVHTFWRKAGNVWTCIFSRIDKEK